MTIILFFSATLGDQPHRRRRHVALIVERTPPSEKSYLCVFMNCFVRDHAIEERCVSAESGFVDDRPRVHVGTVVDQPPRNVEFLMVDRHVQQRRSVQRRAMQREIAILVTTER